jgi:hypothetical protein
MLGGNQQSMGGFSPQHFYGSMFRDESQFGDFMPGYPGSETGIPNYSMGGPVAGTQGSSPFNQQEQLKKLLPLLMMMGMFPQQQQRAPGAEHAIAAGFAPLAGMASFAGVNAIMGNPFQNMMGGMMGGMGGAGQ